MYFLPYFGHSFHFRMCTHHEIASAICLTMLWRGSLVETSVSQLVALLSVALETLVSLVYALLWAICVLAIMCSPLFPRWLWLQFRLIVFYDAPDGIAWRVLFGLLLLFRVRLFCGASVFFFDILGVSFTRCFCAVTADPRDRIGRMDKKHVLYCR